MLLYMSLSGGLMIALILLLRALLQHRVHRRVWLLLWAVAVLRLLLPISVASPTSFFNLPMFRTERTGVSVSVQTAEPERIAPAQTALPAAQPTKPLPHISAEQCLYCGWLLGAAVLAAVILNNQLRNKRRYRAAADVEVPPALPEGVRLRILDGVNAPLTYGIFRPVILLPSALPQDGERLSCVLAHEISHIRNFDVAAKSVLLAAAVVHWFNPLVWVMLAVAFRDMELRADEDALAALKGIGKKAYAETLLFAEEQKLAGLLQTGFLSSGNTENRIRALAAKPRKTASILCAVLLSVLLPAVFATAQMPKITAAEPPAVLQMPDMESVVPTAPEVTQMPSAKSVPETDPTTPPETVCEQTEPEPVPTESGTQPPAPAAADDTSYIDFTVEVGHKKSIYLDQFDFSFPAEDDRSVAYVTDWKPINHGYNYTVLGCSVGTTFLRCMALDGCGRHPVVIRVNVVEKGAIVAEPEPTEPLPPLTFDLTAETEPVPPENTKDRLGLFP